LDYLNYLVIIIGVPGTIYEYIRVKKKEQLDKAYETYNALDEKYLEFLNICLEYPELDIFDIPDVNPMELNEQQKKKEIIAFTILISIFERAYLMYYNQSSEIKKKQWSGWDNYIRASIKRENFKSALKITGEQFDSDFHKYITQMFYTSYFGFSSPIRV